MLKRLAIRQISPETGPSKQLKRERSKSSVDRVAAYPVDTSNAISELIETYGCSPEGTEVSFRDMVPWLKMGERATHHIHPYPAKLLPQIAHFFLAATVLATKEDVVLDPFSGSGTVALETILSGRPAYYVDSNPLARLITRAKTTPIDVKELDECKSDIINSALKKRAAPIPDVANIDYWFGLDEKNVLAKILSSIRSCTEGAMRDFFLTTFSATVRKSSLADPRFSVPVRKKPDTSSSTPSVWEIFAAQADMNISRQRRLQNFGLHSPITQIAGQDARNLTLQNEPSGIISRVKDESVGLIITSPPYAGAQKYIRASSLSLGWLDLIGTGKLKDLENATIGREHLPRESYRTIIKTGIAEADQLIERVYMLNQSRAAILWNYIIEMRESVAEATRSLRFGGHAVFVVGDNMVCGLHCSTSKFVIQLCEEAGLKLKLSLVDKIVSRSLLTKRHRDANVIAREWVLLFEKRR